MPARRMVLAALLAPLAAPAAVLLIMATQPGYLAALFEDPSNLVFAATYGVTTAISYGGLTLVGVPVAFVLHRFGRLSTLSLVIAGALSGALVLGGGMGATNTLSYVVPWALIGLPFGAIVGFVFARIAGITSGSSRRSSLREARG